MARARRSGACRSMRRMVMLYANQSVVQAEDLPGVIRAAEVLGIGVKIENVLVPADDDGSQVVVWMVTRDEETPVYEEWEGRFEEAAEEALELSAVD